MRKTLLTACLLITTSMQAQVLYINNSNGTYQAIDTKTAGEVTFNEAEKLISIGLNKENSIISRFCTEKITNRELPPTAAGEKVSCLFIPPPPAIQPGG